MKKLIAFVLILWACTLTTIFASQAANFDSAWKNIGIAAGASVLSVVLFAVLIDTIRSFFRRPDCEPGEVGRAYAKQAAVACSVLLPTLVAWIPVEIYASVSVFQAIKAGLEQRDTRESAAGQGELVTDAWETELEGLRETVRIAYENRAEATKPELSELQRLQAIAAATSQELIDMDNDGRGDNDRLLPGIQERLVREDNAVVIAQSRLDRAIQDYNADKIAPAEAAVAAHLTTRQTANEKANAIVAENSSTANITDFSEMLARLGLFDRFADQEKAEQAEARIMAWAEMVGPAMLTAIIQWMLYASTWVFEVTSWPAIPAWLKRAQRKRNVTATTNLEVADGTLIPHDFTTEKPDDAPTELEEPATARTVPALAAPRLPEAIAEEAEDMVATYQTDPRWTVPVLRRTLSRLRNHGLFPEDDVTANQLSFARKQPLHDLIETYVAPYFGGQQGASAAA